jgi:hypothetical protein
METLLQVLEIAGAVLAGAVITAAVFRMQILPPLIEAARLTPTEKDDEILESIETALARAEEAVMPFVAKSKQGRVQRELERIRAEEAGDQ